MSRRSLPPLHALQGFEAAARHLSFTRASEELNLTQGAISHQVRELETFLGFPLFRRFARRIELTERGAGYFGVVKSVLGDLACASQDGAAAEMEGRLTVSVLPTIASFWLMPRLHLFTQSNPGIEVRISSQIDPVNLQKGDADVAVRVGKLPGRHYDALQPRISLVMSNDWEGLHADEIFPDILVPVCSPALVASGPGLRQPGDLLRYPLLHTSSRRYAWPDWLSAVGVKASAPASPSPAFGHFFMSLEAARASRGVSIIPEVLFASYDSRDEFVMPFPQRLPSAGEYYLLVPEARLDDPIVGAFRSWILSEAAGYLAS